MNNKKLTQLQHQVTQLGATEPPFSHPGFPQKDGVFICVCCENKLFSTSSKYDSRSGWPSFFSPISTKAISTKVDLSHGMNRVEVSCSNCKAHLGLSRILLSSNPAGLARLAAGRMPAVIVEHALA